MLWYPNYVSHFRWNSRKGTAAEKEYGKTAITYKESRLFEGMTTNSVWMSHTDRIDTVPEGFEIIAYTADCPVAGIQNVEKNLYGVQFHQKLNIHKKVT